MGNLCLFEQNYENDVFLVNYHSFWSIFQRKFQHEFNLTNLETSSLIKHVVEKQLKMNVSTPKCVSFDETSMIEKHFKSRVLIP